MCHGAVCGDSVSLYQGRTGRQGFRAPQPHWLHVLGNQEKYPLEKRTVAKKRKIGEPLNNRELIIRAEETQGLLREKETELFLFLRKKKLKYTKGSRSPYTYGLNLTNLSVSSHVFYIKKALEFNIN